MTLESRTVSESEQVHDGGDDHGHGVPDDGERVEWTERDSEKQVYYCPI